METGQTRRVCLSVSFSSIKKPVLTGGGEINESR